MKDGKPVASEAWTNPSLTSYFTTPVAVGKESIYLVTGTPPGYGGKRVPPRADLRCVAAATGKVLWEKEEVGRYHGRSTWNLS
jgi:outer membrane protein assembly factor BamB